MNPVINEIKELYDSTPYTNTFGTLISAVSNRLYSTNDDVIDKFRNINLGILSNDYEFNKNLDDEIYFFLDCIVIMSYPTFKQFRIFWFRDNEIFIEGSRFITNNTNYYKFASWYNYVLL